MAAFGKNIKWYYLVIAGVAVNLFSAPLVALGIGIPFQFIGAGLVAVGLILGGLRLVKGKKLF